MEKTFREVIRDIKEGEVWVVDNFEIKCTETGTIIIKNIKSGIKFGFYKDGKLKLRRKQYTLEEALEAYDNGKEIESCDGYKYKKIDGNLNYYSQNLLMWHECRGFDLDAIRGKWYIND